MANTEWIEREIDKVLREMAEIKTKLSEAEVLLQARVADDEDTSLLEDYIDRLFDAEWKAGTRLMNLRFRLADAQRP